MEPRFPTKESALEHFELTNKAWCDRTRAIAKYLGYTRGGLIHSEDLWPLCPKPENASARIMGTVFREGPDWTQKDLKPIPSKRKSRHKGPVQVWRYIGPPVDEPDGLEALIERLDSERAAASEREADARERRRARLEARP